MAFELSITVNADEFKKGLEKTADQYEVAFARSLNMVASMMKQAVVSDIQSAGAFSAEAVTSEVDGNSVITTVSVPGAEIFETGGVIHGNPLLWLPISGTDAVGIQAKDYGDKLFSVNRKAGGPPLLFSVRDKSPKYFGTPSVNQPKRFHIAEIRERIMSNFSEIFAAALGETHGGA